jgi:hypothetical protein
MKFKLLVLFFVIGLSLIGLSCFFGTYKDKPLSINTDSESAISFINNLQREVWWNVSFANCQDFIVEGANSAQSNFPVYKEFNTTLLGQYINSSTGKNIQFVNASCSNDGTVIPFEVDNINASTVGYWIKGNLNTSNQTWSMYIDTANTTNYENPTAVWVDYESVYHFQEQTGTNAKDSAIYGNNFTLSNTGLWIASGDGYGGGLNWSTDYYASSIKVSGINGNMNRTVMDWYDNPIPITAGGRIHYELGTAMASNQDWMVGDNDGAHNGKWILSGNGGANDYKPGTLTVNAGYGNFISSGYNGS